MVFSFQDSSLKILGVLTTVLAVKTQDDAQSSDNLDKGAENLYYGIGNIWTAASQDASLTSTNEINKQKIYTKSSKDQVYFKNARQESDKITASDNGANMINYYDKFALIMMNRIMMFIKLKKEALKMNDDSVNVSACSYHIKVCVYQNGCDEFLMDNYIRNL